MLEIHCEHCGRVLIGTRQVVGLTATADGFEVLFVCGCGRPGGEVIRRSRERREFPGVPQLVSRE